MQSTFSLLSSSFRLVMAGLEGKEQDAATCIVNPLLSILLSLFFRWLLFWRLRLRLVRTWSKMTNRLTPPHPTSNNKIKSCCDNKGFLFLSSPLDQDAAVLSRWNGWSDHSANTIWSKMLPLSRSFVLAHVSYLVPCCPVAYWQSYFSIISL